MFANLRPMIARWDALLLGWMLPDFYCPRHARRSLRALVDRRRTALLMVANRGYVTALEYLVGIGFPDAELHVEEFGHAVAEAYRRAHGTEPYRGCLVKAEGRIRRCFGYARVEDLCVGAYCYVRTREFLAAQRNSAVRELFAA